MTLNDQGGCGCGSSASGSAGASQRCGAELPDNPQCAPNYHFGMLLGVDDFRAEQGFHLGRQRRHQRLLHGAGVVAGYPVSFGSATQELRVGPGHAIDALGRDLVLDTAQCVSLPRWWLKHRGDEAFADLTHHDDLQLDLELRLCWHACLGTPVPAIAEPCAGDGSDVAYARICETATLTLVRATPATPDTPETPEALPAPAAPPAAFHLLRMWLTMTTPRLDPDGQPQPADQWLMDAYQAVQALPVDEQPAARAALQREVLARAVAEQTPAAPANDDPAAFCLTLARLPGVHLWHDPEAQQWQAAVPVLEQGVRDVLLPTQLLQALLLAEPPPRAPAAGPEVARDGATLDGSDVLLAFTQALAPASVAPAAFAVSEFIEASGWQPFVVASATYDGTDPQRPTVRLALDRAPSGARVRITVSGTGPAPLLGAQFFPAGALSPDSDGRTLSTTLHRD